MSFFSPQGKIMDSHHYKNFYPFSSTCLFWLCDIPRTGDRMEMEIALQTKFMKLLLCLCMCVCWAFSFCKHCHLFRDHFGSFAQGIDSALFSLLHWFVQPKVMWNSLASYLEEYIGFKCCFHQRSWPHGIFSFSFQFLFYLWLEHYY